MPLNRHQFSPAAALAALAVVSAVLAQPAPALAQYTAPMHVGFTLQDLPDSQRSAHGANSPLLKAASEACRIELDTVVELRPGTRRVLSFEASLEDSRLLDEHELVPLSQPPDAGPAPAGYNFEGGRVVIGIGQDHGYSRDWPYCSIVSLLAYSDGGVKELARHTVSSPFISDVYLLDLTGSGTLDIAVPWGTALAGGGGVDIVSIAADGSLKSYAEDEFGSFASYGGQFSLLDYNSDGRWELELRNPVLCSGCGYYANELWRYDAESGRWLDARDTMPQYYSAQDDFYTKLSLAAELFADNQQDFKVPETQMEGGFACQIDGQHYSLEPFVYPESRGVDQFWVDELKSFVSRFSGNPFALPPVEDAESMELESGGEV